ncbi:MAG TPA: hypothetical protein VHA82_01720 [Ramlibacter sp.]|uniref:YciI family protein n=1 Tax=Ramlibacter sp. TaxID=1917967 RepID=UPI002C28153D|nr:hypothetical protein [Ramlibacter sp.]HVZ42500.1 hypothetical protein [Ramlibacter sp.]
MSDTRHIVFHDPGPAWVAGKPFPEQTGVREHVEHYRRFHAEGKLAMGGPFLDGAGGGMMVTEPGLDAGELFAFAQSDPAVASGLLVVRIRPWLAGMKK